MSAISTQQPNPESPPVAAAEARAVAPLRVGGIEAVTRSRLLSTAPGALLVEVAALLSAAQVNVVVVCDAAGSPVGTVTEAGLVQKLGLGQADFFTTRADQVMTRDFVTCAPEDLLSDVLANMHRHEHMHVLLVDSNQRLLGVVYARDGLRALLAAGNHEEELLRNYVIGIGYR